MKKQQHSIYKKSFSRDCILAIVELWWRAETVNEKKWTKKKQPFYPYIIFEQKKGNVDVYYDSKGVGWTEKLIIELAKSDANFIKNIETNYRKYVKRLLKYLQKDTLEQTELNVFFKVYEEMWVWFDAAWWFWELTPEESDGLVLPRSFALLRENTQEIGQDADKLATASLQKIFPVAYDFVDVLLLDEIINKKIPERQELLKRRNGYFYTDNQLFTDLSTKEIEKKYSIEFETIKIKKNLKMFKGQPASLGTASGMVKIVMNEKDLSKIKTGDVLVSPMTLPDYVSAMKKCVAIITDEGGTLCHAAIISREFDIPCIVGTKIATKVLKDGDMVEIDANTGIIKVLQR